MLAFIAIFDSAELALIAQICIFNVYDLIWIIQQKNSVWQMGNFRIDTIH